MTATATTPLENEIIRLWQLVLEVPEISRDDNFFDLGGHSLSAIELRVRLREALNFPKLRVDLLEAPTVAELADAIVRQLGTAS